MEQHKQTTTQQPKHTDDETNNKTSKHKLTKTTTER